MSSKAWRFCPCMDSPGGPEHLSQFLGIGSVGPLASAGTAVRLSSARSAFLPCSHESGTDITDVSSPAKSQQLDKEGQCYILPYPEAWLDGSCEQVTVWCWGRTIFNPEHETKILFPFHIQICKL